MADITLAEYQGRVWLVGGEPYIDDLLANTLDSNVSIEIIPCEHKAEVNALWVQLCGAQPGTGDPWIIHPGIVDRIRRATTGYSIYFAEWSARLDDEARTVISSVAKWALENADAGLQLVEFVDPESPQEIVDLSALRARLIKARLIEAGLAAERISHSRRGVGDGAGMAQESQRIDIVPALSVA